MQTILLIDSCPLTRECLSTILRAKGYRVQSAMLISQAKSMIAKRPPEMVITEIRLPDDNAINLMRWLNSEPKSLKSKVCILTNVASKKPIIEAIELGASKVILKSKFTINGFIEQINLICAQDASPQTPSAQHPDNAEVRYLLPEPAPDPALALKAIKPIITRSQLNEQIEEFNELNTLTDPIARVLQAIDSPETSIDKVTDLLRLDQSITMKVMRVANSDTFARDEEAATLKDAVIRIGLEHLREQIVGFGVIEPLGEAQASPVGFDPVLFWEHALGVAACAAKIAGFCKDMNPEMVFSAGVLHDIGRGILSQSFPEHYERVLEQSRTLGVPLELVEKRMLLADHTAIAQTMLGNWNLPKDLIEAITHHHTEPGKLASACPKNARVAATIELGNRIIHAMGIGDSGNRTICSTEELFGLLDSSDLNLKAITNGLAEQIGGLRALIFGPGFGPGDPDPAHARVSAPAFDRSFHPAYLTMEPERDAMRHWVMSHADPESTDADDPDDAQPNIIIIHARRARDRQELGEQLIEVQSRADSIPGSPVLPVLILSPTGKVALPEDIITRHPSMHLMTPFSVLHFEQATNHLLNGLVRPQENWTQRNAA